jgi:hypothetical protein
MNAEELEALATDVENRLLVSAFLMCADHQRFGRLIDTWMIKHSGGNITNDDDGMETFVLNG